MKQKAVIPAGDGWVVRAAGDLRGSPVRRIASDWMIITAGDVSADAGNWNGMTASWGAFGELWGRDAAFMFIRPSRRTRAFADAADLFTLSFFPPEYREALARWGEVSGRDHDKAAETGLTPIVFGADHKGAAGASLAGAIGFQEAEEIAVCRKLYTHDFDPAGFTPGGGWVQAGAYPEGDYHRMYAGEVLALLTK